MGFDTGLRVIHPFRPEVTLPVYVANFVLMDYGTGAIFGCPAHDQRDLDFARKYGLNVIPVVLPPGADPQAFTVGNEAYVEDGTLFNSDFLDGMSVPAAKNDVADRLEDTVLYGTPQGTRQVNYRLRDWGISRQRYWGCPIPVIHCETCGIVPGPGRRPAGQAPRGRHLRQAGQSARPPPDLEARRMPDIATARPSARPTPWTPSSIRPGISRASPRRSADPPTEREAADRWLPVDQYIGGIEHAILHLLYSRFFTRAMQRNRPSRPRRAVRRPVHARHGGPRDLPPARRHLGQPGRDPDRGSRRQAPRHEIATGRELEIGGIEKMSKSKRNTVDPTDIIDSYGADTARWFMLSDSPPERDVIWTEEGVAGAHRFVQRVWRLVAEAAPGLPPRGQSAP